MIELYKILTGKYDEDVSNLLRVSGRVYHNFMAVVVFSWLIFPEFV
jgi:hypothetical protein